MTEVGYASLGIIPSFKGFESRLNSGSSAAMTKAGVAGGTRFGDAAGKQAGSRFGGAFKTAAKASLVGLGALGVGAIKLAGDSISAASDLEESTNKVAQVFGKGADDVFRFSSKAADSLGQTNQQARDAAATFGIFGSAAGLADRKNAKFAKRMTKLASDLASFNNTDPSQAVEALGAALRGESEPIRAYGVMLDEATLKAEAMRLGLLKPTKDESKIRAYQVKIMEGQQKYNEAVKEHGRESLEALKAEAALGTSREQLRKATEGTLPPLTQQQKLLAAQSEIFKQTSVAQGDFGRTSDGLANQQRRLSARFEDAKARLGAGLLPIMTDVADFLLDKGIPAFEDFADWFNKKGIPAIKDFADEVGPVVGKVKDFAGYLNDLPKEIKIHGLGALAAAFGFTKLRGGGSGPLGTAGRAVGLAAPVRTFETNPAALGSGLGGGPTSKLGKAGAAVSKAALPVAIVAWSGVALKDFYDWNHKDDKNPAAALSGGKMGEFSRNLFDPNGKADFKAAELERAAEAYRGINDATKKLPNQLDQGNTAAKNFLENVRKLGQSDPKITYTAPGFDELLRNTQQYKSLLDGLNGRTVATFITQTTRNNDTGEGGGGVVPGRSPRGVTVIHNGDIKSDSPRDYVRNAQKIARQRNGGGVPIP